MQSIPPCPGNINYQNNNNDKATLLGTQTNLKQATVKFIGSIAAHCGSVEWFLTSHYSGKALKAGWWSAVTLTAALCGGGGQRCASVTHAVTRSGLLYSVKVFLLS